MATALADVPDIIERFLRGEGDDYEWDDFVSLKHRDPAVERIAEQARAICDRFPRTTANEWCSPAGQRELARMAAEISMQLKNT